MSNLHKDLANDQIHNPKNFDTAAIGTILSKNASGLLEWITDSGAASGKFVSRHRKGYGNLSGTATYCQGSPSGNNENKFTQTLGASPTTIEPKFAVAGSWYSVTDSETPTEWVGHVGGVTGVEVVFELWRVFWGPCQSAADMDMCLMAGTGTLALTGNNTPLCFKVSSFNLACPQEPTDKCIYLITARLTGTSVASNFYMDSTIKFTND